jgi:hypothetical protein
VSNSGYTHTQSLICSLAWLALEALSAGFSLASISPVSNFSMPVTRR